MLNLQCQGHATSVRATRVISVMKALHELAAIKCVYLDTYSYRVPYPAALAMQYVLYECVRDAVYH